LRGQWSGEGGRVVIGDVLDDDGAQIVTELGEERARFVHLDVTDGAQWRDAAPPRSPPSVR
jgi:3alpha(or 20beta)-hydroxysteroid dehydrogenase